MKKTKKNQPNPVLLYWFLIHVQAWKESVSAETAVAAEEVKEPA